MENKHYIPLHVHSHFSLLDGLSKSEDIVTRCQKIGSPACAISDHGNVSGSIDFLKEMTDANLKPILGCELYISEQDGNVKGTEHRGLSHTLVLAKNDAGWKKLIKLISLANHPDNFYHKPRLSLRQLEEFTSSGNLVGISGHLGSTLSGKPTIQQAEYMQDVFGKGNFFIEAQLVGSTSSHKTGKEQISNCNMMRDLSTKTGIPLVATPDAHYCERADADDQRILLCSNLHLSLEEVKKDSNAALSCFFQMRDWHIPTYEEMIQYGNTEEELANTLLISDMCDPYKNILRSPILPPFPCPDGYNPDTYLRELCRVGWRDKIKGRIAKDKEQEYADRVKDELSILQGAGLSSYFLIVEDILRWTKEQGWLVGPGRGSAAGCLGSYLIGITQVDPIPYGLLFSRFYNQGRNTADRISLPDIDLDVPKYARDYIIERLKNKYGRDRVAQMVTFQTMKGRKAIKEVLRAGTRLTFDTQNKITDCIPEPAKVAGELQAMKKRDGESSLIRLALEMDEGKIKELGCHIKDDGTLGGPLAKMFEQAIRLEGTKSAQSRHPAGIVICPEDVSEICPMVYDSKTGNMLAGLEMEALEDVGGLKLDILGIALLDKTMGVAQILEYGDITPCSL